MAVVRWLKIWEILLVSTIVRVLSVYAVIKDNVYYQYITKPHTHHDEIYDLVIRLD